MSALGLPPVVGDDDAGGESPYVQLAFAPSSLGGRDEDGRPSHAHNSPAFRVACNFVNTVVGAGIVGLPATLRQTGFALGLALMCLACVMTHYSILILIRVGIELRVTTYEQACYVAFGRAGYRLVCGCLLVFDFGACLSYLLIMADAAARGLSQFAPSALGPHDGPVREWALLATAPFLFTLCAQRDLSALERWSATSVLLCGLLAAFVAYEFVAADGALAGAQHGTALPLARAGVVQAFGTIAFAFVNNDTAFLLYATLAKPSEARWSALSAASLALALVLCGVFASLGYLTFRDGVSDNLLNDYPSTGWPILSMRLAYAISMALTFPTTFFVVRHVCNELLFATSDADGGGVAISVQASPLRRHLLLTSAIFAAAFGLAAARATLGTVMGLTGGCAGVIIAFVLPPALWLRCNPRGHSALLWRNARGTRLAAARELGPAMLMLAFGCVAAVLAPTQTALCTFAPAHYPSIC